jgi:ferredoxin-fold anticodon binding domain-containing protein
MGGAGSSLGATRSFSFRILIEGTTQMDIDKIRLLVNKEIRRWIVRQLLEHVQGRSVAE